MPKFSYSNINFDLPPAGVYVAQVVTARKAVSKTSGSDMIVLTLRTLPDGYTMKHYLVFNGKSDGLITQFCKHCEGELVFPTDPKDDFSLTAPDALFRIVFAEVIHETPEGGQPRAKIGFGGILSRAKALARAPELANVKLPTNVPVARKLAIMPAKENRSDPQLPPPDDDIPF